MNNIARRGGRPILGQERMVTVSTRVEPTEKKRLENLALGTGMSMGIYLREMIRNELRRGSH